MCERLLQRLEIIEFDDAGRDGRIDRRTDIAASSFRNAIFP